MVVVLVLLLVLVLVVVLVVVPFLAGGVARGISGGRVSLPQKQLPHGSLALPNASQLAWSRPEPEKPLSGKHSGKHNGEFGAVFW